jgi:hypothetical protein
MLNFNGGKSRNAASSDQTEAQNSAETGAKSGAAQGSASRPAGEPASGDNTRKAIEIVKKYPLPGGRGAVETWFANSFLSNSANGSNEEWTATILHGNIFVVQYRLLRPKQDPLIYQFEVDLAKATIARGINNNAIELLDSSLTTSKPSRAKALKAGKKTAPKARKPAGFPMLPLPDEPVTTAAQQDPTGFETDGSEGSEKVRYIVAQESDEELF